MTVLSKPKLYTKFKVASFSRCRNIEGEATNQMHFYFRKKNDFSGYIAELKTSQSSIINSRIFNNLLNMSMAVFELWLNAKISESVNS